MLVKENFSLKELNTFGIDARAAYFASVAGADELPELIALPVFKSNNFFILGGGSNLLFKNDFPGLVISVDIKGISIAGESDDHAIVEAGAGTAWHDLVFFCVERNLSGLENLALIPGKAGAAPVQNIGAYGAEQKDVFYSLDAFDIHSGKFVEMNCEDCRFAYRSSIFKTELKDRLIITKVRYKLSKTPNINVSYKELKSEMEKRQIADPSVMDIFNAVCDIRKRKLPDPAVLGNAGSFFKNPVVSMEHFDTLKDLYHDMPYFPALEGMIKIPAAWLIEKSGFKGYRKGDAAVSENHALVLVNYGSASGSDIFNLSEEIIQAVEYKFNIKLEREVIVVE